MILVTGASGFIGAALCAELERSKVTFVRLVSDRRYENDLSSTNSKVIAGRFNQSTNWIKILTRITCVIHCASNPITHPIDGNHPEFLALKNFLVQVKEVQVRRFVYLSSVKAVREVMGYDEVINSTTRPFPQSDYGLFKLRSENLVREVLDSSQTDFVIVRSPLVYGYGVKGNFRLLLTLVNLPIPLPFACIENRRSIISVYNLIDFLIVCACSVKASNQTFLISDDDDLSTTELLEKLANAAGKSNFLFQANPKIIRALCVLARRHGVYERLYGSLVVDVKETIAKTDWAPPISIAEGLVRCFSEPKGN